MTSMGVTSSEWKSKNVQKMMKETFILRERELLEWAGIDPTIKTV